MIGSTAREQMPAPPLWLLSMGPALGLFASSVHLPSLPAMAHDFGVGPQPVQLTVSIYLGAMAAFALLVGPLSDRLGRRRVGLAMLFTFLLGSLLALAAPDIGTMLAARLIQGIGASGGLVLSRSMVRDIFVGPDAAKASAQVSMAVSLAPMLGPIFGGQVHDSLGWRANFVVVALLAFALWALALLRFSETLPLARRYGGSAASMLANYFRLMRMPAFVGYSMPIIGGAVGFFTFQTEGPILLIRHMHVRPAEYGMFAALPAFGFLLGTTAAAQLAHHVDERYLIESGCLAMIASGVLVCALALGAAPSPWFIGIPMLVFGAGNGLLTPSATIGGLSAAPLLLGAGAALIACLRMAAGSLGSVAITALPSGSAIPLGGMLCGAGAVSLLAWKLAASRPLPQGRA